MLSLHEPSLNNKDADGLAQRRFLWSFLLFLLLIGFLLRVWGITFGLPFQYHIDEPGYVAPAWRLPTLDTNDFTPSSYLIFGIQRLTCLVSEVPVLSAYLVDACNSHMDGSPLFFLIGRLLVAFFGAVTIGSVFLIGKELFGNIVGLIAAIFMTFSFLHIRDSHYAVTDIPQTFFISCAIYCCSLILHRPDRRFYIAAGIFIGLAVATKITSAVLILPFLWAYLASNWVNRREIRALLLKPELFLAVGSAAIVFVVGTGQLMVNPEAFARHLYRVFRLGQSGGFGVFQIDSVSGWLFYLKTLRWGVGDLLTIFAVVGVFYAAYKHSKQDILLLSFLLPYYLYMGAASIFFGRYAIPMLLFLTLLAARLLKVTVSKISLTPQKQTLVGATLVAGFILQPFIAAIQHDVLLTRPDSRTIARAWILENIPPGAKIVTEWYGPPLPPDKYDISLASVVGLIEYVLGPSKTTPGTVSLYREKGFDYLIVSSFIYDLKLIDPQADMERRLFYKSLDDQVQLVKEFKPYSGETAPPFIVDQLYGPATSLSEFDRPGPTIQIYHLKPEVGLGLEAKK